MSVVCNNLLIPLHLLWEQKCVARSISLESEPVFLHFVTSEYYIIIGLVTINNNHQID